MQLVRFVALMLLGALLLLVTREGMAQVHGTTLDKLVVVHRHGSRSKLAKDHKTLAEGGATLTLLGQQQMHQVGDELRQRYLSSPCEEQALCLSSLHQQGYAHERVYASSSGLARTLASAQCLLNGLFPTGSSVQSAVVPVYSSSADTDYVLRGYDKCPVFTEALQVFRASQAFTQKQAASEELRARLASAMSLGPGEEVGLADFFNTFDSFQLARLNETLPSELPQLDDATWQEVKALADWLETSRYSPEVAGRTCGGALLADLIAHLHLEADADSDAARLVQFSAHYPTMLCLLAALRWEPKGGAPSADLNWEEIPPYGAALLFELHRDQATGTKFVRLVYQAGPAAEYQVLPLPCASFGTPAPSHLAGACSSTSFYEWSRARSYQSVDDWCEECSSEMPLCPQLSVDCSNVVVESHPVEPANVMVQTSANNKTTVNVRVQSENSGLQAAETTALIFLCVVIGAAVCCFGAAVFYGNAECHVSMRSKQDRSSSPLDEMSYAQRNPLAPGLASCDSLHSRPNGVEMT